MSTGIQASAETVWSLLTNAADFPVWNSTVQHIDGTIAPGQKIVLRSTGVERPFTLRVTRFEPCTQMVWEDGGAPMFHGVRHYTLTPAAGGITVFSMTEVFSGLMLPMIAGSFPDFRPIFERYAADLKSEAERRS